MAPISIGYLKSEIVTVLVGSNHEKYYLHNDVLCNNSSYFKACLQPNNFSEGRFKIVDLKDVDNQAFRGIVRFLYHGDVGNFNDVVTDGIKTYMLADKLLMDRCKNHIVDKIRARMRPKLNFSALISIKRANMLPKMALKEYLTDQIAYDLWNIPSAYLINEGQLWVDQEMANQVEDAELLQEVLRKHVLLHLKHNRGLIMPNPSKLTGCVYHEHGDGERCPAASS